MKKLLVVFVSFLFSWNAISQTFVDSIDVYSREVLMPADRYKWDWGQATMLNAIVHLYNAKAEPQKQVYFDYIKTAMDKTFDVANGKHPNAVASGHGMAFLSKVTGENKYREKALQIFADYLTTPRSMAGGVSHRTETVELWDDTVYMLEMFLLEMYRSTGDEKYLDEFHRQYAIHKSILQDKKWGLWVHGYDDDATDYDDRCCQKGWANQTKERKSIEFWGRGNGWIVMAIADALNTVPQSSKYFKYFSKELKTITAHLPGLQNKETGFWCQLPIYPNDSLNFQESSYTAMFGYGLSVGMSLTVLSKKKFLPVVEKAYRGLKTSGVKTEGKYLIPTMICEGTCIGNKDYYYSRKTKDAVNFAAGAYIMFGLAYEDLLK